MWRRGGRSAALDRAQALLSSRGNGRGPGESAQCFQPEDTWQQTVSFKLSNCGGGGEETEVTLNMELADLSVLERHIRPLEHKHFVVRCQ